MGAEMTLGEYLKQSAQRRYDVGTWDCAVFPSDWVVINGHADPLAEWRGAYCTDDIGEADDGLAEIFSDGARQAGLIETSGPREGDVGMISLLGRHAGAIYTGRRWAVVAPRGLAFASLDAGCVLKAWSVHYG
jgi:hypothetical protein